MLEFEKFVADSLTIVGSLPNSNTLRPTRRWFHQSLDFPYPYAIPRWPRLFEAGVETRKSPLFQRAPDPLHSSSEPPAIVVHAVVLVGQPTPLLSLDRPRQKQTVNNRRVSLCKTNETDYCALLQL